MIFLSHIKSNEFNIGLSDLHMENPASNLHQVSNIFLYTCILQQISALVIAFLLASKRATSCENLFMPYANNKGAD